MKSGGELSYWKALRQSFRETFQNIGERGIVREWQDSGILPEKNPTLSTASNIERSFVQEPIQGVTGGMVHLFGNAADQARKVTRDNPNPLVKAGPFAYYVAKDTVVGTGENLGEGLAAAYTARTSDQLVEGLSRFYGGVGGAAGLVAGGAAGAGMKATLPTLSSSGSGAASLAVEGVAVGVPAVTGAAGAVAGGALTSAMVGNHEAPTGTSGGGRATQRGATPSRLPEGWKQKGEVIRSLSDDELVFNAEQYIGLLKEPHGGYTYSRPVADLFARELRRRGKAGMSETAQKLEKAIEESAYDHMYVTGGARVLNPLREDCTIAELTGRARTSFDRFRTGVDRDFEPFHRQLVEELRERSQVFEGPEAAAMRSLADDLELAGRNVGHDIYRTLKPEQLRSLAERTAAHLERPDTVGWTAETGFLIKELRTRGLNDLADRVTDALRAVQDRARLGQ